MDELIGPNPRDQLILKARLLRNEQKVLKEEYTKRLDAEDKAMIRAAHKEIYLWGFCSLAYKYLDLTRESLLKLSDEELRELSKLVYEKAKNRLWFKKLWRVVLLVPIPIFGWLVLRSMFVMGGYSFPDYKFSSLHLWHEKNFGPISQDALR